MVMDNKVLVIGLDGFEKSIADQLVAAGRMPHLAKLLSSSARLELDHGVARRTGLAWEHFASGLSPAGARRWSAVTFDPQNYTCRQEPTRLVPFAAQSEFRTVVFDTPYFDLIKAPNVSGAVSWGAHDPGVPPGSRPDSLYAEILERFGRYPAKPWIYGFVWPSVERTRAMGQSLSDAALSRARIARWLLSERLVDWDLGIVVVSELHSAIEALWHGMDTSHPLYGVSSTAAARVALESVYEAVDQLLGILIECFPACMHVVFSMHGMGPNAADVPAMALLPEFLYRRRFGRPHLQTGVSSNDLIELMCNKEVSSWTTFARTRWLKANPVLRGLRRIRSMLRQRQTGTGGISLSWMPAYWYARYWQRMPAFALPAFYDGQIRLNVRGREKKGLVADGDYDALCRSIADELREITDIDSGRPVVREVIFTHPGEPMAVSDTEADILVVWETASLGFRTREHGNIGPFPPRRPGGHTGGAGMGLWSGPGIVPGDHGRCSSFDMVPSLIDYLTGRQAPGIDGRSVLHKLRLQATRNGSPATGSQMISESQD